jgi:TonB-dependent SusC/RagA subfamily outer membrane receptor
MTSFSPRAPLLLGLLVGLVTGCAHSSRTRPARPDRSTVTSEDLQRTPGEPIEKILAGRVAGVSVTRTPDGGIAVLIRGGSSSVHGNNAPLYVLDGIPIDPGPGGSLTGLNPYDIESIKVLKDPATTTMYGIRGANGVIVIKTKQGSQAKQPPQ